MHHCTLIRASSALIRGICMHLILRVITTKIKIAKIMPNVLVLTGDVVVMVHLLRYIVAVAVEVAIENIVVV